VSDIFVKF